MTAVASSCSVASLRAPGEPPRDAARPGRFCGRWGRPSREALARRKLEGAKKYKLGKASKGGIIVAGNFPLVYDGPKNVDKLWEHGGFLKRASVKVGTSRVIRSRPIFPKWEVTFEVQWDPEIMQDEKTIHEIVDAAGMSGIGDWRPKYGRFNRV